MGAEFSKILQSIVIIELIKRLKNTVDEIKFDRDKIISPGLSIYHLLGMFEKGAGPLSKLIEKLSSDPERLYLLRTEILGTISQYFENNFLNLVSGRIIGEVRGINRVLYDITSKPPAPIEWE